MASKKISIDKLEIKVHDELQSWNRFLKGFEIACIGVKFSDIAVSEDAQQEVNRKEEEQHRKGAELLKGIGREGMAIFHSFNIEVKDITYDSLIERFREYFDGRENTMILRHRFMSVKQKQGESVKDFILRAESIAEPCKLSGLKEDLIMHVVLLGLKEDSVRNELLKEKDLDLTKLREASSRIESAERTVKELHREAEVEQLERVGEERKVICFRCKGEGHISRDCPGRTKISCYNCGGDHIARFCNASRPRRVIRCYNCGLEGHIATRCTRERGGRSGVERGERPVESRAESRREVRFSSEQRASEEPL